MSNNESVMQHLFTRHYKKLEAKLREINAPKIYIDAVSLEFDYLLNDLEECELNSGKVKWISCKKEGIRNERRAGTTEG